MPVVTLEALVVDADANAVFTHVRNFGAYSRIAAAVREVQVRHSGDGVVTSSWSVNFRGGVLRWREEDDIDPDARTIAFRQIEGDLACFEGEWVLDERDDGVLIRFSAEFDLGIPSLAAILDPVAERALTNNIAELICAFATAVGDAEARFVAAEPLAA